MTPRSLTLALTLLIAIPATAQNACSLGMTLSCPNNNCTAVTTNTGKGICTGEYVVGIVIDDPQGRGTVSGFQNGLGLTECFDNTTFPLGIGMAVCIGNASLGPGNSFTMSGQVSLAGADASTIAAFTAVLDPVTSDEIGFASVFNNVGPTPTCTPRASVPPVTQSGAPYNLTWTAVTEPGATYTVEESTAPDFSANLASQMTTLLSATFQHGIGTTTTYYYRVRANVCSGAPGPNSATVAIAVQAIPTVTGRQGDAVAPVGSTTPVSMQVFIPSPSGKHALDAVPYMATTDKPYLTVSPAQGTIPPGGTTVTVTANPSNLPPGANTGTLTVTSNGAPVTTKSVSVSLVTPVTPSTTGPPPANALVIPAVAHLQGAFGPFQSDVRLTNASAAAISYAIKFTPSGPGFASAIKTTTLNVDGGQTIALNDVLKDFFGVGAADPSNAAGGALEIRPLNTASPLNYAASRLFTFDPKGNTFGQFIAAIPFTQFATKAQVAPVPGVPPPTGTPTLSLQQVACCTGKFRTNLGLVEGGGSPASGNIKLFNNAGQLLGMVPYSLQAGEQAQRRLDAWGLPTVDDGRIEVTVESSTGAVTAYASVLDNYTQDPLEVTPVQVSQVKSSRYILPGMAALVRPDTNFHSDIRVYNGGSNPATVNMTFYPQGNGTPVSVAPVVIGAGQVKGFDDVVATLFNVPNAGGSIVLTTSTPSSLVATGRTYTIDPTQNNGTFGQFIPGVTPSQGIGAGDRPLQILQLEESTNFRSNLGLVELSGNPAHVRITSYVPDSKTTVSTEQDLAPNQFLQYGQVLAMFYPGQSVYNARISMEVTSGSGRVAAYGSVIDNRSKDPTYVPFQ